MTANTFGAYQCSRPPLPWLPILLLVELERRSDPPSCPAHRLERRAKVETPPPGCRRAGIVARSDACEPSRATPVPLSFGRYALPSGPDGCSSIAAQRQLGGGGVPPYRLEHQTGSARGEVVDQFGDRQALAAPRW